MTPSKTAEYSQDLPNKMKQACHRAFSRRNSVRIGPTAQAMFIDVDRVLHMLANSSFLYHYNANSLPHVTATRTTCHKTYPYFPCISIKTGNFSTRRFHHYRLKSVFSLYALRVFNVSIKILPFNPLAA